ncbi:programmed cell death protein 2 [Anopheles merus]|uniref:MYND-type domain-containing protein n=1 Tax=Anopheles merus TaxID=30066 RepID=A0A182VE32_ANOME|nr:programmed cell death protein 2 [Anopheles merus]
MEVTSVDLGFLEPCEPWLLTNKFFRSKVGGKPAWLELKHLPKPDDLLCGQCNEPLGFLCQVYAPVEANENSFHRTLYVFVCLTAACNQSPEPEAGTIKVLRSQLPRRNEYYEYDPPDETKESPAIKSPVPLCVVCGCRGPKLCSRCKAVNYCSAAHQRLDWKAVHKSVCCSEEGSTVPACATSSIQFPEFEIITEEEEYEPKAKLSEEENAKRQLAELERLKQEGKAGALDELSEAELDQYSSDQVEDKTFDKFKERISADPEQVLRYERGGKPLWLSPKLPQTIPPCGWCAGRRVFEFQIMPQLLNSLNSEQLDWGTLVCYTCEASCDVQGYAEEYIFRQDVLNTDTAKN